MSTAEIEKVKARVAFLNSIASSSIVASVVTPAIGLAIGLLDPSSLDLIIVSLVCALWFVVAYQIHLFALRQLDQLE